MELHFTVEEMKEFLQKRGYTVETRKVNMAFPEYHNETTHADVDVVVVLKGEIEVCKPLGYNFQRHAWLERAFAQVMREALLALSPAGSL